MNEILWIITLIISFTLIILSYKHFGKNGLYMWIVLATIISNIQTVKIVKCFGIETALGTVLYGSTFLSTDILNYKYGVKESKKSILYGFLAMIIMALFMGICLLYKPSVNDFANDSLKLIFSFNMRITVASLIGFGVSQFIDSYLFDKLQKKYKQLWLSNNLSTLICQFIDTIIFTVITYYGSVSINTILEIMLSMYTLKTLVALLDTPFMYIASKMSANEQ